MTKTNIVEATRSYEKWMQTFAKLVPADLYQKHLNMTDRFMGFRGTFFRWIQLFPEICPELWDAPELLAIGDCHVENYSTWRDAPEGRLVWGINDFKESSIFPYTVDLVRITESVKIATRQEQLAISTSSGADALLRGFRNGLESGGRPFVLEEDHTELRRMAAEKLKLPDVFWDKLLSGRKIEGRVPPHVKEMLIAKCPEGVTNIQYVSRLAGQGSLGRQRYVLVGDYKGGYIAREAKFATPPAAYWAFDLGEPVYHHNDIVHCGQRNPDPTLELKDGWVLNALSPSKSRVELIDLPKGRDEAYLLECMGFEIANIHLGTPGAAKKILADLKKRKDGWLAKAAKRMCEVGDQDNRDWCKHMGRKSK